MRAPNRHCPQRAPPRRSTQRAVRRPAEDHGPSTFRNPRSDLTGGSHGCGPAMKTFVSLDFGNGNYQRVITCGVSGDFTWTGRRAPFRSRQRHRFSCRGSSRPRGRRGIKSAGRTEERNVPVSSRRLAAGATHAVFAVSDCGWPGSRPTFRCPYSHRQGLARGQMASLDAPITGGSERCRSRLRTHAHLGSRRGPGVNMTRLAAFMGSCSNTTEALERPLRLVGRSRRDCEVRGSMPLWGLMRHTPPDATAPIGRSSMTVLRRVRHQVPS